MKHLIKFSSLSEDLSYPNDWKGDIEVINNIKLKLSDVLLEYIDDSIIENSDKWYLYYNPSEDSYWIAIKFKWRLGDNILKYYQCMPPIVNRLEKHGYSVTKSKMDHKFSTLGNNVIEYYELIMKFKTDLIK